MRYQNSEQAIRLMQSTFDCMNKDEMFCRIFAQKVVEVEYYLSDLDLLFTVKLERGHISLIEDEAEEPAVIFDMDSNQFHEMCAGTLDMLAAAATRQIKMTIKDEKHSSGMAPLAAFVKWSYTTVYEDWSQKTA